MTALKTRIARQGQTSPPVAAVSGAQPAAISPSFRYAAGPGGAELVPLTPMVTADGAIIPGESLHASTDHVIPAGRR